MASAAQLQPVIVETGYGDNILSDEFDRLGEYVVITSRTPLALHAGPLPGKPVAVMMPGTLERSELDGMVDQAPRGARIVGFGGGAVIDAAKYLARLRGEDVTLVPTIASSNGPFSQWISVRRNGRPDGFRDPGLRSCVIVDFALIGKADGRVNRAGYGDLLPLQTTLNDWRIAAAASRGAPLDPDIEATATELMRRALSSSREIGSLSRHGIEFLYAPDRGIHLGHDESSRIADQCRLRASLCLDVGKPDRQAFSPRRDRGLGNRHLVIAPGPRPRPAENRAGRCEGAVSARPIGPSLG